MTDAPPVIPAELLARWRTAVAVRKEAEGIEARCRAEIEAVIGDAESGVDGDGRPAVAWKSQKSRRFNHETARQMLGQAYDLCWDVVEVRPFRNAQTAKKEDDR
jgi:hypothetical protein